MEISLFFIKYYLQDLFYKVIGFPEQSIKGELALVTGGGGGLGRLLALRLSKLGVDIVIWDINQEGKYIYLSSILIFFFPRTNGHFDLFTQMQNENTNKDSNTRARVRFVKYTYEKFEMKKK